MCHFCKCSRKLFFRAGRGDHPFFFPVSGGVAVVIATWPYVDESQQMLKGFEGVVKTVYMDEKIESYILDIIFATRYPERFGLDHLSPLISFGASPRGSINLATAAKVYAFIKRRGYVIPEDVRAICTDVLRHRIGLTYEAEAENITSEDIIEQIVNKVEVP